MNIKTLKNIIKQGGATIEPKTQKQVNFKNGFQVSFCDCYEINLNNLNEILQKTNLLIKQNKNKNVFVGLWVDNGLVYIDLSKKINKKSYAVIFGHLKSQKSILSWSNMEFIRLRP